MKTCCVALALCGLAAAARPAAPPAWVALRGGSWGDDAENAKESAKSSWDQGVSNTKSKAHEAKNKVKRTGQDINAEQAIPMVIGLVAVAQGLDMLINPSRTNRFFDESYLISGADKTSVAMIGARELLRGATLAGLASRGDHQSLKFASMLALGGAVVDESVEQLASRGDGYKALDSGRRSINGIFRAVASVATLWSLWSLKGKPEPNW